MPVNYNKTKKSKALALAPRSVGRPTILNEKLIKKIEGSLLTGNYIKTACAQAGIPTVRFYNWLNKGRYFVENELDPGPEDEIYVDFYERVSRAQAEAEGTLVSSLYSAALEDWRANVAMIQRRFGSHWGEKKLEIQVQGGAMELQMQQIAKIDPVLEMQMQEELDEMFKNVDLASLLEEGGK